jgi:MOSC domain-containing protein YiiM
MREPVQIRVVGLFISTGHNFFGHHGAPAGKALTVAVNEVQCVAGRGLAGDRFFDFRPDYKGQITFFAAEVFDEICGLLGVNGKSPGATRRNVITRGVDLSLLVGEKFEVQGVVFEGVSECSPCHWMNQAIAPGAEGAMRGRGGLRAKILTDGRLQAEA